MPAINILIYSRQGLLCSPSYFSAAVADRNINSIELDEFCRNDGSRLKVTGSPNFLQFILRGIRIPVTIFIAIHPMVVAPFQSPELAPSSGDC